MTIYVGPGPGNSVSISNFPADDEKYDTNHVNVLDEHNPTRTSQDALLSMVLNTLRNGGADVVHEA